MARELSQKWWLVIRRQMRATPFTEHKVQCPDCGSPTHIMQGKWGRFYRCDRVICCGTWGAKLDGTPRKARGSHELLQARERAMAAVHLVLNERERVGDLPKLPGESECAYHYGHWADTRTDMERIAEDAALDIPKRIFNVPVLHLRKRTIEELGRVEAAAVTLYLKLVEEADTRRRKLRGNAWDHIYLGILEDEGDSAQAQ